MRSIALAAVTAVLVVLIAYEAIRFREARERVRANPHMTLAEMRGQPLAGGARRSRPTVSCQGVRMRGRRR